MEEYLTKLEAMRLLGINNDRTFFRHAKKHNIRVKKSALGYNQNLYNKNDIMEVVEAKHNAMFGYIPISIQKTSDSDVPIKFDISDEKILDMATEKSTIELGSYVDEITSERTRILQGIGQLRDEAKAHFSADGGEDFAPLNKIGQAEYNRLRDLMIANNTFREENNGFAIAYAIAYQNFMYYTSMAQKMDHLDADASGRLKIHPYHTIAKDYYRIMLDSKNKLDKKLEETKAQDNPFAEFLE